MIKILSGQTTSVNVAAALTVGQNAYTARAVGVLGNKVSITYIDPGVHNSPIDVVVTGSYATNWIISVYLATNGSGTITSTATQVAAAIANNFLAATLVTTVVTTGTAVQTALALTSLAGGVTGVYKKSGNTLIGLQFLNGFTGTTITFLGSVDGVNFGTVYDTAGVAVSITIPAYVQYMITSFPPTISETIGKLPFLQLKTGSTQVADVNIAPIVGVV